MNSISYMSGNSVFEKIWQPIMLFLVLLSKSDQTWTTKHTHVVSLLTLRRRSTLLTTIYYLTNFIILGLGEGQTKWLLLTCRIEGSALLLKSINSKISCGVLQGSILDLLFFIIYINDIHKALKESTVYNFADDTNLLFSHKNPNVIRN